MAKRKYSDRPKKETEVLGETAAKATRKLWKIFILDLARQAGRDKCFRCNLPIMDPEHLSLDHKQSWRYHSKELFWDLDNLALSHKRCNTPHTPRSTHCQKGHEWTDENTGRRSNGARKCRACARALWHEKGDRQRRDRRIRSLRAQGMSYREIEEKVNISHVAVFKVVKRSET